MNNCKTIPVDVEHLPEVVRCARCRDRNCVSVDHEMSVDLISRGWIVRCLECGTDTAYQSELSDAVDAWNGLQRVLEACMKEDVVA